MSKNDIKKFITEHKKELAFICIVSLIGGAYYCQKNSHKTASLDIAKIADVSGGILVSGVNGEVLNDEIKKLMLENAKKVNSKWFHENYDIKTFDAIIWPYN